VGTLGIVFIFLGLCLIVAGLAAWSPPAMVGGAVMVIMGGIARDLRRDDGVED